MTEEAVKTLQPKFKIEEVGPCKVKIQVEISPEKIQERIETKYKELSDNVALPGFRKGRAPQKLLERKFGKGILEDLKFQILNDSFDEIKEEKKLEPIGEPEIDVNRLELKEDAPFTYEITFEVRPQIEVKDYNGIKVKKPKVAVKDEELDAYLNALRESKAEFVATTETAKENDQVIGDFELCHGQDVIEKTENTPLQLNDKVAFYGMPLPEFYKKLVGKKAGATVEYDIKFPKQFKDKKLVDQEGSIRVAIKSVKHKKVSELNDEFAKTFDMDSVKELKDEIGKRIMKEKEAQVRQAMGEEVVRKIIDQTEFALPEGLVQTGTNEALQRMRVDLTLKGAAKDAIEKEVEKYKAESRDQMVRTLKGHFILDEIANKERIFITEDDLENHVSTMAQHYGKWPHEMKQFMEQQDLLPQIRRQLREEKTREFLLSKAAVEAD